MAAVGVEARRPETAMEETCNVKGATAKQGEELKQYYLQHIHELQRQLRQTSHEYECSEKSCSCFKIPDQFRNKKLPVIVVKIGDMRDIRDGKVRKVESGFPVNVVDFRLDRVKSSVLNRFLESLFHALRVVFLRHLLQFVQ